MRRPEAPQLPEVVPDTSERVDRSEANEQQSLAQQAFAQLRPEQQQVLQLAIHHGCSHEQIATATGMPLGTVKTHARRGLIKIRQILAEQGILAPEDLDAPIRDADGTSTRGRSASAATRTAEVREP
jgi:RNA polymerase sigma-70 factor (ECF subfamily)